MKKTGLLERVDSTFQFAAFELKWRSLVSVQLSVYDSGKRVGSEKEDESVVLGAEEKGERAQKNDGGVLLSQIGVVERLLASVVGVAGEGATVETDIAYLSCQSENEALVYFQRDSEHTGRSCCGETIGLAVDGFVKGWKGTLHELLVQLLAKNVLSVKV